MGGGDGEDSDVLLQWWLGLGTVKVVKGGKKTVHYRALRRGERSHKFSIYIYIYIYGDIYIYGYIHISYIYIYIYIYVYIDVEAHL